MKVTLNQMEKYQKAGFEHKFFFKENKAIFERNLLSNRQRTSLGLSIFFAQIILRYTKGRDFPQMRERGLSGFWTVFQVENCYLQTMSFNSPRNPKKFDLLVSQTSLSDSMAKNWLRQILQDSNSQSWLPIKFPRELFTNAYPLVLYQTQWPDSLWSDEEICRRSFLGGYNAWPVSQITSVWWPIRFHQADLVSKIVDSI